ncbi:MAG: peptidase, partial [Nitrosopumilus sp.]
MKTAITAIAAILLMATTVSSAYAEVPAWVKNNAGWWADGSISESDFLKGIEFLINDGIIQVPPTSVSAESSEGVPAWVKNNAGWWADGITTDGEFVNAIQHLMSMGLISVASNNAAESAKVTPVESSSSELAGYESELEACSEIKKAYDRLKCEKAAEHKIAVYEYKQNSQTYQAGPITYYWSGLGTEGNSFEISSSGQALLYLRFMAENTGSDSNEALYCTGPAVCNYDVTNGSNDYKYSQMDFTSAQ